MPTSRSYLLSALGVVFLSGLSSSIHHAQPPGNKPAVDAVFIIDASMTMGVRDGRHTRLQQAQAEALAILDKLPPGSTVQIIAATDQAALLGPIAPNRLDDARGLIHDIELTSLSCDLAPALESAAEVMQRGRNKNKNVYLFTDLRAASWKRNADSVRKSLTAVRGVELHVVRCGQFAPNNVAVLDIVPAGRMALPGARASYAVVIANTGLAPVRNLQVDLMVDGDAKNADALPIALLKPGETRALALTAKMSAGTHVLTALVKHDDLDGDNRLDRVVHVPARINVLIVDGGFDAIEPERSSSFALRHALLPVRDSEVASQPIQVRVVTPTQASPAL